MKKLVPLILVWCIAWLSAFGQRTSDRPYEGYRMHVSEVALKKLDTDQLILEVSLINTGKKSLKLKEPEVRTKVQINFDPSIIQLGLEERIPQIERSILREKLTIKPGGRCSDMLIVVPFSEAEPTEVQPDDPIVSGGEAQTVGPKFSTKRNRTPKSVQTVPVEETPCFDLIIERVWVLKRNKKFIELELVVRNQGEGSANLYGDDDAFTDNLAVKAYISGVPQLSRGAILLGGLFFDEEIASSGGQLAPRTTFTARARFDLRAKTRYLNQFILALDAGLMRDDCDRTNDTYSILLED